MNKLTQQEHDSGASVVVVGAGGNIGSHLVPHLGRMARINRITLIDRDTYEGRNLRAQDITIQDIGKPKALVQARRLQRINPNLSVRVMTTGVENIPLGHLQGDVILACLDSREARRYVNQAAWRLGVPWINAGVEPGGLLAKIEVFVPGSDGPCLECGWDEYDYAQLAQYYPCQGDKAGPSPTNAPSSLGALAAGLQAIECQKLLAGQHHLVVSGRQVLIDASFHKHYVSSLPRRADCRFDHEVWSITAGGPWRDGLTIGQALDLGKTAAEGRGPVLLQIEGQAFVRTVVCPGCGYSRKPFRLQGRLRGGERWCAKCGLAMVPVGFELLEKLDEALPRQLLSRSLRSIGLASGDVCNIRGPGDMVHHYQLGDGS